MKRIIGHRRLATIANGASLAVLGLALTTPAWAQTAPAPATDPLPTTAEEQAQDIVVTGYRQSLQAALSLKRNEVSSVDAIVAEDIAKFPDQNLAESLQRIPGISIQKDGGEGRAITVRGLGAQFTRVRVNGLETITTTSDGASANRDRSFDFNVFASELFSSLVVHKTAEASLDEGSLGAVVDLNTGNPLAGKKGLTVVGSATGSYNDLSKNVGPRVAGLVSWKNPSGTLGASASVAYSKTNTLEVGNNTVRWGQAYFDSVDGTPCYYSTPAATGGNPVANSGGSYRPSAVCDKASLSFHPRIPRYGVIEHDRERLGITGSLQWAPSDMTKISIDGLYSRFKEIRDEKWAEVLLRSNERSVDVVNPVYDGNGNMVSATFNDAYVRTEHYNRQSTTEFYQIGGLFEQKLSDSFRFNVRAGISKSHADIPVETTIMFDDRDAQGYKYDYSNMNNPVLSFGTSVTNPANFQLAELRDAPSTNDNKFKTVQFNTEWEVAKGFTLKAGGVWRRYNFDLTAQNRNTQVCAGAGRDKVLGTVTCTASSVFGANAVYGLPVTAGLAETVKLPDAGQPGGTTTEWLVANLPAAAAYTNLYNIPLVVDAGNNRGVQETTKGGYLQVDAKGDLLGLDYALNAGMRYIHTDQSSYGLTNGVQVRVNRGYDDWLPAMNIALYPRHDIIVRGAVAKVMTRPALGQLTPGGSASGFAQSVSFGNPDLAPYRATSYDLSVEWYFRPESVFSVALFKKDIESFPLSTTRTGTFLETGLPPSVLSPADPGSVNPALLSQPIWQITSYVNGTGASLKGVEVALQMPFSFLPGVLRHFGMQANATFVDSNATYRLTGAAAAACTRTTPTSACAIVGVPGDYDSSLYNLSKTAYNATLYYDDGRFSVRGSLSYRGPFNDQGSGNNNVFEGYESSTNFDASIRYKLTEWVEMSVQGTNLLDTYRTRYVDEATQRAYENNHFGRTILFGARFQL
jgi:TonB-dependent receptor